MSSAEDEDNPIEKDAQEFEEICKALEGLQDAAEMLLELIPYPDLKVSRRPREGGEQVRALARLQDVKKLAEAIAADVPEISERVGALVLYNAFAGGPEVGATLEEIRRQLEGTDQ